MRNGAWGFFCVQFARDRTGSTNPNTLLVMPYLITRQIDELTSLSSRSGKDILPVAIICGIRPFAGLVAMPDRSQTDMLLDVTLSLRASVIDTRQGSGEFRENQA